MQLPDPPRAGCFERVAQRLIMCRGVFVIFWNMLRLRMGRSYYPTRDPYVAGLRSSSYSHEQLLRTFNLPAWHEGGWSDAGKVICTSGRLIIADPGEFPSLSTVLSVLVEDVPPGVHRLELQRFWLGRGYGRLIIRARVIWGDVRGCDVDFEYLGSVAVDLAMLSVADVEQVLNVSAEAAEAAGFNPIDLMTGEWDYTSMDPLGGTNRFFHVFKLGFGDGCYPVFSMATAGRSQGLLIDMTGLLNSSDLKLVQVKHLPEAKR